MKQLLQNARTGGIAVTEVPAPKLLAGCVLVRTAASLVSAGTERASSEFARKNLFQKARMRPDLVRQVLQKISRDGLASTVAAVRSRLDQPASLGYSSAGTVLAVGEGVSGLSVGDRVACAGAGHAVHAEFACVPRLLAARIPGDNVSFEHAAFTTVGAVALHGIRTADAKLGEVVAVIGLGLLGQLTAQILKAAGGSVLGMDLNAGRAELALRLGADAVSSSASDFRQICMEHSGGRGADAVLIAAQSSNSEPVQLGAEIARDRGVLVAVGAVGMEIDRRLFYEKELDFRVSRSYGPGRYDEAYEQKGTDYPIGYVRWTETRNMEAFLRLLSEGKLDLEPLITHRFPIERAPAAYDLISGKTNEPYLGVVITYPAGSEDTDPGGAGFENEAAKRELFLCAERAAASTVGSDSVSIGLLGAGSFARSILVPAIKRAERVTLVGVCAANGAHARHAAEKFGFKYCATDEEQILNNTGVNTVVIATRHHLHATQTIAALNAGKHVFCEKPLCLNADELFEIAHTYNSVRQRPLLMVGFNRRFAPLAIQMKRFVDGIHEPLALHYRVNAGFLARDHWLNDPEQGGGRIIGEVCHFVDLLIFLAGSRPVEAQTQTVASSGRYSNDNVICSLAFENGSRGTISYLANGDQSYSKERVEVFGGGSVAVLEDFRRLELVRQGCKHAFASRFQPDKGHRGEWQAFTAAIREGKPSPIPFAEICSSMLTTFALEESRSTGQSVRVRQTPEA